MRYINAVSDFVERYVGIFVLVGFLFLTGLGVEVYKLVEAQKANSHNQLRNRVANVETWCNALNQGRDYSRASIVKKKEASEKLAVVLRRVLPPQSKTSATLIADYLDTTRPYTLPDLPCAQLERETELSTHRAKTRH